MNRKGVTVTELLIYIVLFSIVSLLIGRQFKGLIANYTSNNQVVRQQSDARGVLGLMIQEIRNTGLKVYLERSGDSYTRRVETTGTTISLTDLSSFTHTQGDPYDELTIYKLQLDKYGNKAFVDTTRYYVEGTTLKRAYASSTGGPDTSVVSENVYALQFAYGVLTATTALIENEIPLQPGNWEGSPAPTMGTSSATITRTTAGSGYLKFKTTKTVTANQKYKVTLKISTSGGFPANLSWMQVSFQNSARSATYGLEKFKPYTTPMEITVPVHTTSAANEAFLYLDYSATGAGKFTFSGLSATCSQLEAYSWTYDPTDNTNSLTDKINVKAIRLHLLTRTSQKASVKSTGPISVGTEVSVTPSGEYAWRLSTETVETPNNGRF